MSKEKGRVWLEYDATQWELDKETPTEDADDDLPDVLPEELTVEELADRPPYIQFTYVALKGKKNDKGTTIEFTNLSTNDD